MGLANGQDTHQAHDIGGKALHGIRVFGLVSLADAAVVKDDDTVASRHPPNTGGVPIDFGSVVPVDQNDWRTISPENLVVHRDVTDIGDRHGFPPKTYR